MEQSKNIYQRINEVMQEVRYIKKDGDNRIGNYKYVSHDKVVSKLHDAVTKAGIVIITDVLSYELEDGVYMMHVRVEFVNIDNPTDRISTEYTVPSSTVVVEKDKPRSINERTFGSTYSYACKYALLKMFMLETGLDADEQEDDDVEASQGRYDSKPKAFTVTKPKDEPKLTSEQVLALDTLLAGDEDKLGKVLKAYSVDALAAIKQSDFDTIIRRLTIKKDEK